MSILKDAKQKYPELFEKQICKICKKEFYYSEGQIRNVYRKLLNNKISFICCCQSHTTKFQLLILGNPYATEEVKQKRRLHFLEKYGVEHNSQIPGRKEAIRHTSLTNIDENCNNSYQRATIKRLEKMRNDIDKNGLNALQRAARKGVETKRNDIDENGLNALQRSNIIAVKTAHANVDESGLNALQRGQIRAKETRYIKHGDPNWNNREQAYITAINNIDDEGLNSFQRIAKLSRNTFQRTRGVDNISQTQEWKDKIHNKRDEINKKIYDAKKKNGTFNTSESENMIYQFLLYKFEFEDIIHHYKDDKRYPFECDFYIKSLDLFIELNFFWTHGYEPFDKNNIKHVEQLNKLIKCANETNFKQKKKDGYKNAIYIWTIDDPNKLETFKKNNLNYKIFYNLDEFLDWFASFHKAVSIDDDGIFDAVNAVNFEN